MMQYRAGARIDRGESALRRSADLAVLRCDVVQSGEPHVQTKFAQCRDKPIVTQPIGALDAHAFGEIQRRVQRVGDGVARFDEHRAATGASSHYLDAFGLCGLLVDLVRQ